MKTPWEHAKRILSGKSRGGNLMILGVFLILLGGWISTLQSIFGFEVSEVNAGKALIYIGIFSFVFGVFQYAGGN